MQVRLRLSALLAAPGLPPAILPWQLASSAVPVDPEVRAEIRRTIESGLTAPTIAMLAPHRLDAVVPALACCDPDAPARSAPARVRHLLAGRLTTPAPLSGFTIGEIGCWPGFGPTRAIQLIGAAIGAALDFVAQQPSEPDRCLRALAEALAAAGDERDGGIFQNGVLPLGLPVTRPELAVALGIGTERVRQLAARATDRVGAALAQAPAAVRNIAATASGQLGAAAPYATVDQALTALGLPALPDTRSRLLLWMAGPYREVNGHPGWVAVDPAGLVRTTRRLIHDDGGVRPVDHVAKELRVEGMLAEHVESWLDRQPVRVGDGLVVATTGRPGDVAERALHAHGRAMTVDEIAAWVHGVRLEFEELRSAPDRRFVVTAGHALALAEWGDNPDPAVGESPFGHYPDR